jgi:type IV pilus assembly protein PilE
VDTTPINTMKTKLGSFPKRLRPVLLMAGFTLIELMIVVAVVGVLAAIAYPSYQCSVERSQRAAAVQTLYEASQYMERFFTTNNGYDQNLAGTANSIPAPLNRSPRDGVPLLYDIALSAVTQTTYTLSMTARNASSCTPQCGVMRLNQLQTRTVLGVDPNDAGAVAGQNPATVAACWQR